ncbi:MAG TPA: twin-arginine translocation signal domain-containing protein [bacterium]|nr:twin-arginine translocation signal domain-containing protein [bacterium]
MNRFLAWLASLTEAEKSLAVRPAGLSRRGFLRALGVTAVGVSLGGVLTAEVEPKAYFVGFAEENETDAILDELVRETLEEWGRMRFSEIIEGHQQVVCLKRVLSSKRISCQPRLTAEPGLLAFTMPG